MRIRLLSVGKPKDAKAIALHDLYAERIVKLGPHYRSRWVPEARAGGRFSDDHVRERESRALQQALEDRGTVVALDRSGELIRSEQLAERLERWANPGVTFVVGGPLGLHRDFCSQADRLWSLSPLTFPHELVRVIVAEQIYRALTILRGIPYHK